MRALALFLALLVPFAGCVQEAPAGEAGPGAADPPGGGGPAVVDDGPSPMATDVGHMPHMHDYWDGRERVTLFDDTVDPTMAIQPFFVFAGAAGGTVGSVPWRLPDGAVVMEGSGQMDVTAAWDDPRVTSLAFSYRIGANGEWSGPLPLAAGKLASITLLPAMTDLPHQTASRWEFVFFPAESPGVLLGPFELKVEIVKLRDIMLFPGHPELFGGEPEKVLHDKEHEHTEQSYAARTPQIVTDGGFQEQFVAPDELVPMETKAMRVELDILDASANPGEVAAIRFFYRGANTSFIGHPTVLPLEGSFAEGRLVYQWAVAPEETDTPYGEESQWLFFVEPATKFTGHEAEPDAGGMTEVHVKYHLKVIAYDHELDAYSKREGEA